MSGTRSVRGLALLGGLGLAVALTGCAHVSQEDLDAELADLREEMREGDEQNAQQIQQVDQRVDDVEGRVDGLEQDLESLRDEFGATVQRLESALRFSTPVHFAFDEAEVRPEDTQFLDRFASVVQEYYPDAVVTVEGFTDPAGSAEYNLQLGQERADAVRSYLIESGLSEDRLRSVSYGENTDRLIQPNAAGPGEEGRSNRRVVLVIDDTPPVEDGEGPVAEVPTSD